MSKARNSNSESGDLSSRRRHSRVRLLWVDSSVKFNKNDSEVIVSDSFRLITRSFLLQQNSFHPTADASTCILLNP